MLEQFDGTILLVSHDRYLINRLATQIWNLDDGRMSIFAGTYAGFVTARDAAKNGERTPVKETTSNSWEERKAERARRNEERKRQQAAEKWEEIVHTLETKLSRIETDMAAASQAQNLTRVQELANLHAKTQAELDEAMETWAELAG